MNHPFTCMIAGPTKAGKTTFVKNLVENCNHIINKPIHEILWFYSEDQPAYKQLAKRVTFIEGPPDLSLLKTTDGKNKLVILDDLMQDKKAVDDVIKLFSRGCHHWNVSLIHIVQNAFFHGLRTSRINSDYLVLFKNPADNLQISILARHLFPGQTKYFMESFKDATKKPHGYLMIDLTQYTPDEYRLKTDIFSQTPTIYVPQTYKYESVN